MTSKNDFDCREVSRRFIETRTQNKLNQEDLAEILGVSLQSVKNYEKAGSNNVCDSASTNRINAVAGMKLETLFKMANCFNTSADYLIGLSNTRIADTTVQQIVNLTGLTEENILRLIAWNNFKKHSVDDSEIPPPYTQEITEDLRWTTHPDTFADSVFEFTNILLNAYLRNPRMITKWYMAYMYSLHIWHSSLANASERDIFIKADEIDDSIKRFGLVTTTAEDSAARTLSRIMEWLSIHIESQAKEIIQAELNSTSSNDN